MVDYSKLYLAYEKEVEIKNKSKEIDIDPRELALSLPGIKSFIKSTPNKNEGDSMILEESSQQETEKMDGFKRMDRCRLALDALDRQVIFHFLKDELYLFK
jgi:hypothetical protein